MTELTELTATERDLVQRVAENPLDLFQGKSLGWLEDFIRITVGNGSGSGAWTPPVGAFLTIAKDLTAQTSEYVYEDSNGVQWLYCNGAAVSKTTYADLYAFFGAAAYAADSGGNFLLPDARGRALFFTGTNAATQRNDNDGVAVASRQAAHQHTVNATTSSDSAGTPSGTISGGPFVNSATVRQYDTDTADTDAIATVGAGNPTFSGSALAGHAHTVSGTAGSGMAFDGPAHLFVGSLLVKF